jgi:hypothetical protein
MSSVSHAMTVSDPKQLDQVVRMLDLGLQYGWARIQAGRGILHHFILRDYAFGDVGDRIKAGQKSSNEMVPEESDGIVPQEETLGGLALGAVGLLAWRKKRSRATRFCACASEESVFPSSRSYTSCLTI